MNFYFLKIQYLFHQLNLITCFSKFFNKIDLLKFIRKLDLLNCINIFLPKISEALLINGNIKIG